MSKSDRIFEEYANLVSNLNRSFSSDNPYLSGGVPVVERRLRSGQGVQFLTYTFNTVDFRDRYGEGVRSGEGNLNTKSTNPFEISTYGELSKRDEQFLDLSIVLRGTDKRRIGGVGLTNTKILQNDATAVWLRVPLITLGIRQTGAADNLAIALKYFNDVLNGN